MALCKNFAVEWHLSQLQSSLYINIYIIILYTSNPIRFYRASNAISVKYFYTIINPTPIASSEIKRRRRKRINKNLIKPDNIANSVKSFHLNTSYIAYKFICILQIAIISNNKNHRISYLFSTPVKGNG
jgi:hypothetical protein